MGVENSLQQSAHGGTILPDRSPRCPEQDGVQLVIQRARDGGDLVNAELAEERGRLVILEHRAAPVVLIEQDRQRRVEACP
ncbi:hypothetical protein FRZ44_32960 [Hypericibacter terrae]|jgi:hypothetical protein|uniref:Uncharacterized protein n=1 Tax=Hypericibacter terrae TaxID=2602015 RepID=A0A5J6MK80_9PROT|nr:hypothetical protein [Hypericibacter terrae]QEX17992.1 hypothetical protein FRZ44_32960 [Hypericibacter terrae]